MRAVNAFGAASHAFSKIKHLRGMALAARGMYENRCKLKNAVVHSIDDEASEESFKSEVFTSSDSENDEADKWWTMTTSREPR